MVSLLEHTVDCWAACTSRYAAKNGANGRAHTSFSSSQSHSLVGGGAAVGDAAELEAFSPGATGGLLTVVGVQGALYGCSFCFFSTRTELSTVYRERHRSTV